jgi:hypothetical protein
MILFPMYNLPMYVRVVLTSRGSDWSERRHEDGRASLASEVGPSLGLSSCFSEIALCLLGTKPAARMWRVFWTPSFAKSVLPPKS